MEDILAFLGSNVFNSLIPIGNAQISNPQLKIISFPNYKLQTAPPPCLYLQVEEDTAPPLYISDRNLEKSNRLQSAVP